MHIDVVKEFYARLTLIHYKKKDVARSNVRGVEIEFDHLRLTSILGILGNNGISANKEENEEVQNQSDFDWEEVIDEAALQGESGSGEKFFDAEDEVPGSEEVSEDIQDMPAPAPVQQKEKTLAEVDPSTPTGSILDPVMSKLQAEFERACANRIQADLEKAQAENARLLALLQQAQSQPKP
ncbi:hypothetical protein Dimus_027087 [Dionaea muscipula]